MKKEQIAAQLYTVRDHMKTPEEMAVSLKKVRDIGYTAVQVSGIGPIEPTALKAMTDNLGLTICATHTGFPRLQEDIEGVIAEHRCYGCRYIGIGSMPGDYVKAGAWADFAADATAIGRRIDEAGFKLVYHNHSFELEKVGGHTGLEIIYGKSDPAFLLGEIDTYWIQHGGGDPVAWIKRLAGRLPVLHLKDMGVRDRQQTMAEIGEGNLDWPAIFAAGEDAGVEWFIVEQDNGFLVDPFQSLRTSYDNILRITGI